MWCSVCDGNRSQTQVLALEKVIKQKWDKWETTFRISFEWKKKNLKQLKDQSASSIIESVMFMTRFYWMPKCSTVFAVNNWTHCYANKIWRIERLDKKPTCIMIQLIIVLLLAWNNCQWSLKEDSQCFKNYTNV